MYYLLNLVLLYFRQKRKKRHSYPILPATTTCSTTATSAHLRAQYRTGLRETEVGGADSRGSPGGGGDVLRAETYLQLALGEPRLGV